MDIKEFNYCKEVYDDCCLNGLLEPTRLKKAYWIITGREEDEPVVPVRKAKLIIFNFFQHQAAQVLNGIQELLNATPTLSEDVEKYDITPTISENVSGFTQTHTETPEFVEVNHTGNTITNIESNDDMANVDQMNLFDATGGLTETKEYEKYEDFGAGQAMADEIEELKAQYKDAESNVKRSITMKIKAIKKRMDGKL